MELVRVVGFSSGTDRSSVGFGLWKNLLDFAKSHWIWRDLIGSWWDLGGSRRDQADLNKIWPYLDDFLVNTVCVLVFSTDRIENWRDSSQIWSGLLKINFSASNSPTDPPFSSSRGRDPLLTHHRHRVGRSSSRIEWFLLVGRVSIFLGHP